MTCRSCSAELPDGARFCPSCGRPVEVSVDEERRVVTVLFADVVGFTAWSEHLDPERVKRMIDSTFERMVAAVRDFGGGVDKVLGDGLLAVFGAPIAHENDPERAIRAGLRMHEQVAAMNDDLDGVDPIRLRIGVNTGEVLVGTVSGTDDYTAMGDAVNVAARLQALAPPGGIYVGDSTASLAGSRIEFALVDDLGVRGREQTERVWRVVGPRPSPVAPGAGISRPFVGRTSQRALLSSLVQMAIDGRSVVAAVSGEAGSGKTRLVEEVLDSFSSARVTVFAGVCAPFGEDNVWAPIADALFLRLGLDPAVPADVLRDHCRERALEMYRFDADEPMLDWFVEGVLHLAGQPSRVDRFSPADAREALFGLVVEGIRRRSEAGPVVMWIDDLQWADQLVIDLLNRLTRSIVDRPVLILTAQRDDIALDWPPAADLPITVRLPLDPLGRDEADALVASIVGDASAVELTQSLYERSGGNPLYLVELAELAAEQPDSSELPGSLRGLIAARLDRLDPQARALVDNASVLGTSGPLTALGEFAAQMDQGDVTRALDTVVENGLIDVDGRWWRFRSDVVREVAYQTLTKTARAQRHAGTATVMLGMPSVPIDQVAHHAASAAELVREIGPVPGVSVDIATTAIGLLVQAVERSLDVGAFSRARELATRALVLQPSDPAIARELLLRRAVAHAERREPMEALADADAALAAAEAVGDRRHEAIARRLRGTMAQINGDLAMARRELDTSVALLREIGDEIELAASMSDRGFVEVFGGSLAEAERLLAEAEELAEHLGDRRRMAWVQQHQAWVAFLSGDTELADRRLHVAADMFRELGDQSGIAWALGLLAYVRFMERRLDDAAKLAVVVRDIAQGLGDRWAPAMMDTLTASILLWSGRFSDAEDLSRRALAVFRDLGDRFGIVQALAPRMRALVALGRWRDAERSMEEAVTLSASFGDLAFPTMAAAGTAVHLGLGERAVQLGDEAVARICRMGADGAESRITLALGLCQADRVDDAMAVLVDVTAQSPYAASARALAMALSGDVRGAIECADVVASSPGASYLDEVVAEIAAVSALVALDDRTSADDRLASARKTADRVGDVVVQQLVGGLSAALFGGEQPADLHELGEGWRRVIDGLVTASGASREMTTT